VDGAIGKTGEKGNSHMNEDKKQEQVRVLRVIEYTGPRDKVEDQIERSLHGTKRLPNGVVIKGATLGDYPEILEQLGEVTELPDGPYDGHAFHST
jgi:hypothetical protein